MKEIGSPSFQTFYLFQKELRFFGKEGSARRGNAFFKKGFLSSRSFLFKLNLLFAESGFEIVERHWQGMRLIEFLG